MLTRPALPASILQAFVGKLVIAAAVLRYAALDLLLGAHSGLVDQQKRGLQRFAHAFRGELHCLGWRKFSGLDSTIYFTPQFIRREPFLILRPANP